MSSQQQCLVTWKDALSILELSNPRAFDYYYHFHYIHGLREGDLSPYERLMEIGDCSPSDCEVLAEEFWKAIQSKCTIKNCATSSFDIKEDGFHPRY